VATRAQADEGSSQRESFAAQLDGLASPGESEEPALLAAPRAFAPPSNTLPPRAATPSPRRTATPAKDSKKENDTKGVVADAVPQNAHPPVQPLQFQFPQRDGNGEQSSDSSDTRQQGDAAPTAIGLSVAWNAVNTATAAAMANLETATSQAPNQPKVRSAEPEKAAPSSGPNGTGVSVAKPELAFAARVQPATASQETTNNNRRTSDTQLSADSASALRKASNSETADATDTKDAVHPADPGAALQHAVAVFEQSAPAANHPAQQPAEAAGQTAQTAPVHAEAPAKPTAPLKEISLQVSQPGEEKVEVRVVQQSGEVHVAVRTGDADLTHGLRQGLTDLVGKLEDNGYRADTWRPGGSTAAAAPLAQSQESQSASGQSHYGDTSGRQNGSQQNGGQQNHNPFNRPRWVEALESSLTGEGESTGETNGIGN
jgi:hypothetical protein